MPDSEEKLVQDPPVGPTANQGIPRIAVCVSMENVTVHNKNKYHFNVSC